MGTITNPHIYGTTSGVSSAVWITDDIDYPHSGLIKALSQGIRGNYAIKGSATDFDITLAASTFTTIAVLTGEAYRDGKLVTIAPLSATNLTGIHATEDVYQLLVARSSDNTMVLRGSNSVTNRLPDLTDGDIPIAVIKLVAGSAQGSAGTSDRLVQFLTTSKVSNDLSIGYDSSGYTETANIVGASGVTTITAASSTDVKVKLAGTAAGDTFEVIDSAAQVQFKVQGDGEVSTEGLLHSGGNIKVGGNIIQASDGGSAITLDTSDNVTIGNNLKVGGNIIQASDGGNTITLDTSDNVTIGNNLKVGGNVIQASDGGSTITMDTSDNVTIGGGLTTTTTATVGTDLTVTGGDINLGNGQDGTLNVNALGAGSNARNLTITSGNVTAGSGTANRTGGDLTLSSGAGSGTGTSSMVFKTAIAGSSGTSATTPAERMRIHTNGFVGIGTAAPTDMLHLVSGVDQSPRIVLENTQNIATDTSTDEPEIIFLRSGDSNENTSGDIGKIRFRGKDSGDAFHDYCVINADAPDETAGTEDGRVLIYVTKVGNSIEHLRMSGSEGVIFNHETNDINFMVAGNTNENVFFIDANTEKVGIGTGTPSSSLEIQDGLTTTGAVLTLSTKETTVVDNDIIGQVVFKAPLETGADALLPLASIHAEAAATFDATTNTTDLVFSTALGATAAERVRITSAGKVNVDELTASEILITDANKNLTSAAVATYPSLAELAYVKGLTSAIQTQLDTKLQTGLHPCFCYIP